MLPNLFLIGVARSGTTTLVQWLQSHPDICFGGIKEPKFLSYDEAAAPPTGPGDEYVHSERIVNYSDYEDVFSNCGSVVYVGDGSSDYFYHHELVIPKIRKLDPNSHIIICLRENIDRAYSAYMNLKRDGRETLDFEQALEDSFNKNRTERDWMWDIFWGSMYFDSLSLWKQNFKNVHIVWYDDLTVDPQKVFDEIIQFLGLTRTHRINLALRASSSGMPKNKLVSLMFSRENIVLVALRRLLKRSLSRNLVDRFAASLLHRQDEIPVVDKKLRTLLAEDWRKCRDEYVEHAK